MKKFYAVLLMILTIGSLAISMFHQSLLPVFALTTTPLPTGVSEAVNNHTIPLGEPLILQPAENPISVDNIDTLEVVAELWQGRATRFTFTADARRMGGFVDIDGETPQFMIWDLETYQVVAQLRVDSSTANTVGVFSPDGEYVVFNNYPNPGWIEVWHIATDTMVRQYQGGTRVEVGFLEDGQQLLAVRDYGYQIWDFGDGRLLEEGQCYIACSQYGQNAYSQDFSKQAGYLVRDSFTVVDTKTTGKQVVSMPESAPNRTASLAFSPLGNFATAAYGTTYLVNLNEPDMSHLFAIDINTSPLIWTPDESILILSERTPDGTRNLLWDVQTNTLIDTSTLYDYWSRFTPDGAYLVTVGINERIGDYVLYLLAPTE